MSQIDYTRAAKYFLLADVFAGLKLGLKYFFKPKATLNYPHEKALYRHGFAESTRCAAIPMAKNAASLVSFAKRSAPRKRLPSMQNRAMMAADVPPATILI